MSRLNEILWNEANISSAGQENCQAPVIPSKDIRDLGLIMMELIQGYVKDNGAVGIDKPELWEFNTLRFLSDTTSVSKVGELLKVRLSARIRIYY